MPEAEILFTYGILTHEVPLGGEAAAFVYRSRKGRFHIFVGEELAPEKRQEVFMHEIRHILVDMSRRSYILGLDMVRTDIEVQADHFFREMAVMYRVMT